MFAPCVTIKAYFRPATESRDIDYNQKNPNCVYREREEKEERGEKYRFFPKKRTPKK
jgi:hypothetical protein